MSGYSEEDDEADRAYWSQVAHGGAGRDHDETDMRPAISTPSPRPRRVPQRDQPEWR